MIAKHGEGFSLQDYLKAIAKLEATVGSATVTSLASALTVKKPSVSQMLRRLNSEGLVSWEPRKNIKLTKRGRYVSNNIIRNHRILESFFTEFLKLDLLKAHIEAEKLEHVVSQEVIEKMFVFCGGPKCDPHGQRIPPSGSSDLSHLKSSVSYISLLNLELGAEARVMEFVETNEDNLKAIIDHDIKLADKLKRLSQNEFLINGKKTKLSSASIASVLVQQNAKR